MSNQPKSMRQIRHILQLQAQGASIRQTVKRTGYSRNTIRDYLGRWASLGLAIETINHLDYEALGSLLLGEQKAAIPRTERQRQLVEKLPHFTKELKRLGVTRQLLWQEYRAKDPEDFGYTQFCAHLGAHLHRSDAVMHFEHKAGEEMMIDFAGKTSFYVDPDTGECMDCQVFVAVLPCSGYCYVKAVPTQRIGDFVHCIANRFSWLGGVPRSVTCDNLRSGVKCPDRYEPKFTDLKEQLSVHYGCTFMATLVARPRDKALVERHVQIVYQRVYAPLQDVTYTSLRGLNEAIK
ncbi:MAG: IS21 family transposase [Saprospiraceae bacterium]|nr:MAG: IS21 family transposase [Saprospiraceae bacterium]